MELKVGTVLNFSYNGFFSKTIRMSLGIYWSHSAIVYEVKGDNVWIGEATGSKTKQFNISAYNRNDLQKMYDNNIMRYYNHGLHYIPNMQNVIYSFMGIKYDYYSIIQLAVKRILGLFKIRYTNSYESKKSVDCSEAVFRILVKGLGLDEQETLKLINVEKADWVTPQHLDILYYKLNDRMKNERQQR
jgi:hypothetical protein